MIVLSLLALNPSLDSPRFDVKLRNQLMKTQLLILDDFGLTALTNRGRADLLELLDDRVGVAAGRGLIRLPRFSLASDRQGKSLRVEGLVPVLLIS